MHSVSIACLNTVFSRSLVSEDISSIPALLSNSSRRVGSIGMRILQNSQKPSLKSSSASYLTSRSLQSASSQTIPSLSNPFFRSITESREIELSVNKLQAYVRVKSGSSPRATFFCSSALSMLMISLKQFLWSQLRHSSTFAYFSGDCRCICYGLYSSSAFNVPSSLYDALPVSFSGYYLCGLGERENTSGGSWRSGERLLLFVLVGLGLT